MKLLFGIALFLLLSVSACKTVDNKAAVKSTPGPDMSSVSSSSEPVQMISVEEFELPDSKVYEETTISQAKSAVISSALEAAADMAFASSSPPTPPQPPGSKVVGGTSPFLGEYFDNYQGPAIPKQHFDWYPEIRFNWANQGPENNGRVLNADRFSTRYHAHMYIANKGDLKFRGSSDDGMIVYLYKLDERQVIYGMVTPTDFETFSRHDPSFSRLTLWSKWEVKAAKENEYYAEVKNLEKGVYGITIEYFEAGGAASMAFKVEEASPPPLSCLDRGDWEARYFAGNWFEGHSGLRSNFPQGVTPFAVHCYPNQYGFAYKAYISETFEKHFNKEHPLMDQFTVYLTKKVHNEQLSPQEVNYKLRADDRAKMWILHPPNQVAPPAADQTVGSDHTVSGAWMLQPGESRIVLKVKEDYGISNIDFELKPKQIAKPVYIQHFKVEPTYINLGDTNGDGAINYLDRKFTVRYQISGGSNDYHSYQMYMIVNKTKAINFYSSIAHASMFNAIEGYVTELPGNLYEPVTIKLEVYNHKKQIIAEASYDLYADL